MAKKNNSPQTLLSNIIKGIEEVKGKDITVLDLSKIPGAVCKTFVICCGDSTTQVQAIASSVDKEVKQNTGQNPWHTEGLENREWILLDYADTVVHVFLPDIREFYDLENLWADAPVIPLKEVA